MPTRAPKLIRRTRLASTLFAVGLSLVALAYANESVVAYGWEVAHRHGADTPWGTVPFFAWFYGVQIGMIGSCLGIAMVALSTFVAPGVRGARLLLASCVLLWPYTLVGALYGAFMLLGDLEISQGWHARLVNALYSAHEWLSFTEYAFPFGAVLAIVWVALLPARRAGRLAVLSLALLAAYGALVDYFSYVYGALMLVEDAMVFEISHLAKTIWYALVAGLIALGGLLIPKRAFFLPEGRCLECGYPADGLSDGACPECGTAIGDPTM